MDKWGVIRACESQELIEEHVGDANLENDLSAVEYELVYDENGKNDNIEKEEAPTAGKGPPSQQMRGGKRGGRGQREQRDAAPQEKRPDTTADVGERDATA